MNKQWAAARRILIARLDNLGDVLLATPAVRALRHALPAARITLWASPVGAQVADLDPDFDDAIVYRAPWMDPDRQLPQDPAREAAMVAEIRRRGFDGVVIFTSYHESALPAAYLCYQAGVSLRHAASVDGPGSLLTSRHRHPDRSLHEVERGLDLVAGLGVPPVEDRLVLVPGEADRRRAAELVANLRSGGRPVIVIHPGCSCPARTYPPDLFAAAARALQRALGARIVWTGDRSERHLIGRIQAGLEEPGLCLAGETNLSQLAAVIEACDIAITNNTGPMHVAAAVQTPVVALFALTNPPEQWRPWRVPHRVLNHAVACAVCYQRECPYGHECLRLVTADEVVNAARDLLRETDRAASPMVSPASVEVEGRSESSFGAHR